MSRLVCTAILLLCELACDGDLSYPPPPQRTPVRHQLNAVLHLKSGQGDVAWASVVEDVLPPAPDVDWRWTRAHPGFLFQLLDFDRWAITARVTAVAKVLESSGPQRIAVFVNREFIASSAIDRPGTFDLTFAVPAQILRKAQPAEVRLDIDPCLRSDSSSEKGLPLCVLLHSVGFVRTAQ